MTGADTDRIADPGSPTAKFGDRAFEVGHANSEMVVRLGRGLADDEVHLLCTDVEPEPVEAEVGSIAAYAHAERVDVESLCLREVADGHIHVMDAEWGHGETLCARVGRRAWCGEALSTDGEPAFALDAETFREFGR